MNLYPLIRPLLMAMDPERAHRLTVNLLKTGLGPACDFGSPALHTKLWGREFSNPLGLAAGFDKDAEALASLFAMGFGFVEAGTVTPRPQAGNPKPRILRDAPNRSVINRMGFPGRGLDVFEANVRRYRRKHGAGAGLLGVNIGMNKDAPSPVADYSAGVRRLAPYADYITVNISSPNTAGLRNLQRRDELDRLLEGVMAARDATAEKPPLLVKLAPDLDAAQRGEIAETALRRRVDGLVISNTTVTRPAALAERLQAEKGGLSGRLLTDISTAAVADFYRLTGGALPIVGVGGISSAVDAYAKIRAGASLVQVYTGLIFEGPRLVKDILSGLAALLARDGFDNIAQAVGADHAAGKPQAKAVQS
jgi:dihydroorotate dehydrogenase